MITITPSAARQILGQQPGAAEVCLRLAARLDAQGTIEYGLGFDEKAADDVQVVCGAIRLLIAPGSVELLTGATLDYVEINPGEPRFIFINPNDPSHKPVKREA
jgi:iron-sulfur cluster assembly protein